MEPQTFDFKPDTPKLGKEMQATLAKTEVGKEHAEHVLRTLKGLKITGTYRITKK